MLITVLGGSTNVLHLIAIARSVGVNLTLDDMQRVSDRVPMLADFKPSGQYRDGRPAKGGWRHTGSDEDAARSRTLRRQLHGGDAGRGEGGEGSAGENRDVPSLSPGQLIVRPLSDPIKKEGHIQILTGNLNARRLGGEDHRQERPAIRRPGARLRL
ncbi:MAG: dihydroxy-acid dehydratase [Vicinamibacterales bacterium]